MWGLVVWSTHGQLLARVHKLAEMSIYLGGRFRGPSLQVLLLSSLKTMLLSDQDVLWLKG